MKIAILGAGTVGTALAKLFSENPKTESLVLIDSNGVALAEIEESINNPILVTYKLSIEKENTIIGLLKGFDVLISALPAKFNLDLTQLALKIGIHYIDLGGRDGMFESQKQLHQEAEIAEKWIIPNCGLAPGMLNVMVMLGMTKFDTVNSIRMRAAGLPVEPIPPLNYQLGFSPIGLIDEYIEQPLIIQNGKATYVNALDGYETLSFRSRPDLGELESFYVSSRITTLARELEGKVNSLDFKTVRYKGHRDIFKALFLLGFDSKQIIDIRTSLTFRELLIRQVSRKMPFGSKDFVVGKVLVDGHYQGKERKLDVELFHESHIEGMSAIMACTAIPVVVMAELITDGNLPGKGGVYAPEHIVPHEIFLESLISKGLDIKVRIEEN
jgi:lysine 6-dehydrogenase